MQTLKSTFIALLGVITLGFSSFASADSVSNSVVGVGGYDLVSYQTSKKPLPGNGNFVATVDGVNYLFSSKENLKRFNKDQEKYLPQYGGFCAYGVAVGKKFIADPNVWEVVDGKLYLNLDNGIKTIWAKDIAGNIEAADENWPEIKSVPAAKL